MKGLYLICYIIMLVGYAGISFLSPDLKGRLIGIILLIANALIFLK